MAEETPNSRKKPGEGEEKDEEFGKSGYKDEQKENLWQKETPEKIYSPEKGWEDKPAEEPKKTEVERKVIIFQHQWVEEKDYVGPNEKGAIQGEYGSVKAEGGFGYYEAKAQSELSYNLEKAELNLNVIQAKAEISAVHEEVKADFDIGSWLAGTPKLPEPPEMPAPPAVASGFFAARVTDSTTHGSPLIPGIGSTNVFIGGMPAWRAMVDFHACPIVKGLVPDVGGVVMMGSPTVLINSMMACRVMDIVVEIPGGPNPIAMGCPTVLIGSSGGGGGGSAAGDAGGDAAEPSTTVSVKQSSDLLTAGAEAQLGLVADKTKVKAEAKLGAMATVAKGAIEGNLRIPLWGDHAITLKAGGEGSVLSIGAEAHAKAGWEKDKGFEASVGAKAAALLGIGLEFSIGFK